jgi:hypothetical protein
MIFPWRDMVFLSWQQKLHKEVPGHYSSESMALHLTPWISFPSNPRSLGWEPNRAKRWRPCSGDGDHRRWGLRGGKGTGAHEGSYAPRVESWGGRMGRVRRRPETTAAGSTSTARLRRWTWAKILRTRTSESWGTCTCHQFDENMLDRGNSTETDAAAARKNAGERRESTVMH